MISLEFSKMHRFMGVGCKAAERPGSSPDLVKKVHGIVLDKVGLHWRNGGDENHGFKANLLFSVLLLHTALLLLPVPYPVTLFLSSASFTFDPFLLHWTHSAHHDVHGGWSGLWPWRHLFQVHLRQSWRMCWIATGNSWHHVVANAAAFSTDSAPKSGFEAELAHINHVFVAFIFVLNCAAYNQRWRISHFNVEFLDHLEHGLWNNIVVLVNISRATSIVGTENCMVAIHQCKPSKKKSDATACSMNFEAPSVSSLFLAVIISNFHWMYLDP